MRNTAIEHVAAATANGTTVYEAGETTGVSDDESTASLDTRTDRAVALGGRYDARRRWLTRAAAARTNGRLTATVDVATRNGEGTLVESAWQTEANRLAAVDGVTGVWIAEIATAADGGADTTRLAAAAPSPGQTNTAQTDAWSRWNRPISNIAEHAASLSAATATSTIELLSRADAVLLSAAPIEHADGTRAVAIVVESRADDVVNRMRREAATGLVAAAVLIAVLAAMTTWAARRWLTRPVEAMADAARHLQAGERPPAEATAPLQLRRDEIGGLARSFKEMTEQVLARHEELTTLVADKTHWLQDANRKLTETQQRISSEIGLARTVQHALVPQGTRTAGNLTLCSRMTPAKELGGDFINIDAREDGRLFLAVCDVSGKGVAAALFMAVAQSAIAAAAERHDDVREVANEANGALNATNPLGMFVTGVIAVIDTREGRIEYVDAGHEAPLVVAPGRKVRRLAKSDNIPLGLDPGEQYHLLAHEMAPGETIAAYTDGITDACNTEEELYGEPRLHELLQANAGEAPEKVIQELWTAIDLFSGRMAAADDKTCTVIRRHV
ncbi:MAG: SpoIIE family protein phosphatase [Acidobacteria bacterium]|nr:SpoIIE family protein phosphatase [Acidobacteriota bacterium]